MRKCQKNNRLRNKALPSLDTVNMEPIVSFRDMQFLARFGYLLNKPFANGCFTSPSFTPLKQQPSASITTCSESLALCFNSFIMSFIRL